MNNNQLYKKALQAIRDLFGDKSVSARSAIENLNALQGEISIMIDSLGAQAETEEHDDATNYPHEDSPA